MPFCSRCGVEVEADIRECPLCQRKIQGDDETDISKLKNYPDSVISAVVDDFRTVVKRKKYVWELLTILFLISIVSVLAIDLSMNKRISWSFYPIAAILTIWADLTVAFFIIKRAVAAMLSGVLFLSIFLFLIDWFSGGDDWFFPIAFPIIGLLAVISFLLYLLISRFKTNGLNTAGFICIGIVFFCIGIENILTFYHFGRMGFSWSLVVAFSLGPVSVFLIYLHYRFTSGKRYEGLFHL